jgi:hypothetical protein
MGCRRITHEMSQLFHVTKTQIEDENTSILFSNPA